MSDTLIALNDNTPLFKKAFKQFKSKLKNDSNSKDQNIDSTSVLEKKEPLSIPQLFKSYQKEDVNNYYLLDSTSFQDTLEYEELEDLALSFCSSINFSYSTKSTSKPLSLAKSAVMSTGNPKVS